MWISRSLRSGSRRGGDSVCGGERVDGAVREVFHERVAESRRFAQGVGEMHSRRRGESAVDRDSAVDISHSEVRRKHSETVRGFI